MSQTEVQLIKDAVIVNADISSSAAIAGSKISPSFTTNIALTANNPNIRFDDSDTNNNGEITLDNSQLRIEVDEDNAVGSSNLKFRVDGSDKASINASGLSVSDNLSVTGNTSVAGVLDVAQKITHTGDTDTFIQFLTNAIDFETAGVLAGRFDGAGRLLIGTTTARSPASIAPALQVESTLTGGSSIGLTRNSANTGGPSICLNKTRGTSNGADVIVNDGDQLGVIRFSGSDGGDSDNNAATIQGEVDGTPGTDNMPGRLVFSTAASGNTANERMRIKSDGKVGINNTTPNGLLDIGGNTDDNIQAVMTRASDSLFQIQFRNESTSNDTGASQGKFGLFRNAVDIVGMQFHRGAGTGAGALSFTTGGTERLKILADGTLESTRATGGLLTLISSDDSQAQNQLIGKINFYTSDPSGDGPQNAAHIAAHSSTSTGSGGYIVLATSTGSSGTTPVERVRITADGHVGIGTASPQTDLVIRAGNPQFTLEPTANTQTCRLQFCTSDGTIKSTIQGGGSLDTALRVVQDSSEVLRLDSSGNVGIGTTSPAGELHISSGTSGDCELIIEADTDNSNENDNPRLVFRQDGGSPQSSVGIGNNTLELRNGVSSGGGIIFATTSTTGHDNAVERMRVLTNGDVRIGATTSDGKLGIKSAGNGSGGHVLITRNSDNSGLLSVRNDGGIFTGNATGSPLNNTGGSANVNIQANGRLRVVSSSRKYKKDILDASWGLAEVLKLRPVTFKFNGTGENADDHIYGGLIAEEVHDSGLTDFVEYREEDGSEKPRGVHYGNMVSLMAKAIQELAAKVTALETA